MSTMLTWHSAPPRSHFAAFHRWVRRRVSRTNRENPDEPRKPGRIAKTGTNRENPDERAYLMLVVPVVLDMPFVVDID